MNTPPANVRTTADLARGLISEPLCDPKSDSKKPALRVEEFGFAYPNAEKLLSHVSFSLEQGAFALLVGATGSGKTTLLRSIKPEIAPTGERSGYIQVFEHDATSLSLMQSATMIGYVFQSPENQIVCDTVWHELAFGLENLGVEQGAMRRRVAEVAHFFGIEPWLHARTASLSGGQKQIVTLASILVMQPQLLLLDEPTAQLDPVAEKNFLHALFRINRELGITVLVATHTPETMAAYAAKAFCLKDGRIESLACDALTSGDTPLEQPEQAASPPASPVVSLRDTFFRYTQHAPWVLRGLDIALASSSIHALIGGNGSGKSTILNIIAGTLKPQRGKVSNTLIQAQAILPQNPKALFVCDTVNDELREWQQRLGYTDENIMSKVQFFNLEALLEQHPYDLSGGQQQKLALAKLLLTQPKLLLLDEPTKGLDTASRCDLADALLELRKAGTTLLIATHDLAFVSQVADTATMIFDGQAVCTEPIADFFDHNMFYRPKTDAFLRRRQRAAGLCEST